MMMHFVQDRAAIFPVTAQLGIDLAGAIRDGGLRPEDLSSMMSACAGCWHQRKCAQWQANARGTRPEAMAGFCPLADDLASLKATGSVAVHADHYA